MDIHPKNPDFNLATLPLFGWAIKHQRKALSYPAVYLAGKYHLKPLRASLIAELMGLGEGANDSH